MNPWIEKLKAASSKVERDEILLRDFKELKRVYLTPAQRVRLENEIEDQLRALANLAFPTVL